MKCLVVLSLLLLTQAVFATSPQSLSLSSTAKHFLKEGSLFKLELLFAKEIFSRSPHSTIRQRLSVLKEIGSSPVLEEEARNLVLVEHGEQKVETLNQLIKIQNIADSLEVDINLSTAFIIQMAMIQNEFAIRDDRLYERLVQAGVTP